MARGSGRGAGLTGRGPGSRRSSYYHRGPEGCGCRERFCSPCAGLRREGWVRCERRSPLPQPVQAAVTSVGAGLEMKTLRPSRVRAPPRPASVRPELLEQKPRAGPVPEV
ncbi:unnamed protein product [Rangifer tarandus platyrhynchus]|uniref:Uncharacterized protein n=2 Tax=Rangifer tarandus platyrhynchus TaxID=3082113 RepID=A0ABN8Y724_RANTA|nr:unnamed protein product [Rangifer tarandus platyrhynchus]CAI9693181.1 unnamed protein product [Rangifer tarandus platyrhynchus]